MKEATPLYKRSIIARVSNMVREERNHLEFLKSVKWEKSVRRMIEESDRTLTMLMVRHDQYKGFFYHDEDDLLKDAKIYASSMEAEHTRSWESLRDDYIDAFTIK